MTMKAKRRLTDIKFEHEGAHVALVGPLQGGPANGIPTLITKATIELQPELIEKASTVTVTMQFPEFLRKFFGMYWDDAEVLSAAMGYGRTEYPDEDVKDWIDQRVEAISIMKNLYRADNVEEAFAALSPEDKLAVRQDQAMLEKALGAAPDIKPTKEEPQMETILKSAHLEAVAEVQKSLDAQAVILKAAQDELAVYKAAEAAAKVELRKSALVDAKIAADQVDAVLASLSALDDTAFAATVATMKSLSAAVDASEDLQELGVSGAGAESQPEIDRTTEILKAKYGIK